mmetsp:Transcript_26718/g.23582  ORF Transcript_26718/g.23582 Transcript_26718/m.23582 type:complete len:165 (+) Transcript_26718:326-820(+)
MDMEMGQEGRMGVHNYDQYLDHQSKNFSVNPSNYSNFVQRFISNNSFTNSRNTYAHDTSPIKPQNTSILKENINHQNLHSRNPLNNYKSQIPYENSNKLKWDKFQRLEEEITKYQHQIDKMEKLRVYGRKRLEHHRRKHDESLTVSTVRLDTPPNRDISHPDCL